MGFWDLIFGKKTEQHDAFPKVRLGRFTDSYKGKAQYESWDAALSKFEDNQYMDSYKEFFKYLREDKEDNVRWLEENGGIRFEILQGSKRVSGFADARQLKAEAKIAQAKELSVAFMRRLVEANYSLDYSRYALDDENNLIVKFDTFTLDGSPYKLYYALKEVAINADKQDDLLLDEFAEMLTPVEMGSKTELPESEKEAKYNFIKEQIEGVLEALDKAAFSAEKYPGGISYLLLSVAYKVDYLTTPEGFIMETIERIHRSYFDNKDGKTMTQKNAAIRKELEKILQRSKELIFNELYATSSTFGVISPKGHDTLVGLIDGELPNMDWYEENKYTNVALSVPGYIVGNSLFNYALPKPARELLELYYRITEPKLFSQLGFSPEYFDASKEAFKSKDIKNAIRKLADNSKEKFPALSPDLGLLDFKNPCRFARTYLLMVKSMDFTPKA
jgi:hypothetical protein